MSTGSGVATVECGISNPCSVEEVARLLAPGASVSVGGPGEIRRAGKAELPGDGAFGHRMGQTDRDGSRAALAEAARTKSVTGIRAGMRSLSGAQR